MNGYCLGLVDLQLMAGRGNNIQTLRTAGSCFPQPFGGFFLLLHVRRRLEMNDSYIQCLKICRKKGATLTGLYRSLSHHSVSVRCRHPARLSAQGLEDWSRWNDIITDSRGT